MDTSKNSYYRNVSGRGNALKTAILDLALAFSSYPRLLLEVFIRKNFGQRYFSLSSVITLIVILAAFPFISPSTIFHHYAQDGESIFPAYLLWYVFLAAFLLLGIKRHREIVLGPSVYNFEKYSLFSGEINPFIRNFEINGKKANIRVIETIYEPALFFIAGLFLMLIHQKLGGLLVGCSILYSLSYMGAYNLGDHFIMDQIDEIICNEELGNVFVEGMDAKDAKYFEMRAERPENKTMRRKISQQIGERRQPVEVE